MKHVWDAIATVAITTIVLLMAIDLVKPYVGIILLVATVLLSGSYLVKRYTRW